MKQKVLIVDKMADSIRPLLEAIGMEVVYEPDMNREAIMRVIHNYHGLIIRSKTSVDAELLSGADRLKFVARAGAGVDNLDEQLLTERGIRIFNAPEGNRSALGEHSVGMILLLLHKLRMGDEQIRNNKWDREANRGYELRSRTVGIFGYGYMGSGFAEKLTGFECKVIAYDKYKEGFGNGFVAEVDLDTFKAETEILSINVPLTKETKGMFDETFLRSFPKLFLALNTARGEVLVLRDLVRLLNEGRVWGAALDVLENEEIGDLSEDQKKVFETLKGMENVVLTPHVAGWTFESYDLINRVLVDKISNLTE